MGRGAARLQVCRKTERGGFGQQKLHNGEAWLMPRAKLERGRTIIGAAHHRVSTDSIHQLDQKLPQERLLLHENHRDGGGWHRGTEGGKRRRGKIHERSRTVRWKSCSRLAVQSAR